MLHYIRLALAATLALIASGAAAAPGVTRERMYLESMERLFAGTDKIILDTGAGRSGVVPYLPLTELGRPQNPRPAMPQTLSQAPPPAASGR
jgi:membrane protease subunit HflK